jgi:hypothetical protein
VDRVENIVLAYQAEYLSQIAQRGRDEGSSEEPTLATSMSNAPTPPGTSPKL